MGMDYVGAVRGYYSLNWTAHSFTEGLLCQLGADLRAWARASDGDEVSAETCRAWAHLLTQNINRVLERRVRRSDDPSDGYTWVAVVSEVDVPRTAVPAVFSNALTSVPRDASQGPEPLFPPEPANPAEAAARAFVDTGPSPINDATRAMILGFTDFLLTCGGCTQW